MVTPVVLVRVHTRENSGGLLLATEQVREVDPFTGTLVLVADTLTSGGSEDRKYHEQIIVNMIELRAILTENVYVESHSTSSCTAGSIRYVRKYSVR